jgi:hypothetical protein
VTLLPILAAVGPGAKDRGTKAGKRKMNGMVR